MHNFVTIITFNKPNSMKKLLSLIFVCAFFVIAHNASAQFTKYNWASYGVSFEVPSTHQVKKSNGDMFESGDQLTWLEMYPYKNSAETADGMIHAVIETEEGLTTMNEGSYKVGGYEGYWITCEVSQHPTWQFWYIGFIDPASDVNFYAKIWFKKGNAAASELAKKMSMKFKKM